MASRLRCEAACANRPSSFPIPSAALFAPNTHDCSVQTLSNSVYLFVYTDPTNPSSTCALPLTEENRGPTAVTDVKAVGSTADAVGGVTVSWTAPPTGPYSPTGFEILCTDGDGKPEALLTQPAAYSVCQGGKIDRRLLPLEPSGGSALYTAPTGTLAALDPHYACGFFSATTTSATLLLDPTQPHQIMVAAVDNFGNATPSAIVTSAAVTTTPNPPVGTPAPSHGCAIGGAAGTPSPWALAFVLLALGGLLVRGRRARRRL
jgi:hypothetical protein